MAIFYNLALILLICRHACLCQRGNQVILTCGGSNEDPIPGPAGPPGKRGPPGAVGPRGVQGPKGGPGANNTWEDDFRRLEAKMEAMETELKRVNVSVAKLASKQDELEKNLTVTSGDTNRFVYASCKDALQHGMTQSGVYNLSSSRPYQGYCDMQTDGGGWLVVQKRFDGSTNFYRGWREYENGFGSLTGEFWLGLELMHELTSWKRQELRVDLQNFDDTKYYAKYSNFNIGSSGENYRLTVGGYTGDAVDKLEYHNQRPFSTHDRDHDSYAGGNCAVSYHGAWWYGNCHHSNLNGKYYKEESGADDSNYWRPVSRKRSEMKIRPVM